MSCCKMFPVLLLMTASIDANAQLKEITGAVRDGHGNSLPSISVNVERTKQGTLTDTAGSFTIRARQGAKLRFTGTGLSDTVVTVSGDRMEIVMTSQVNQLRDVIISKSTEELATPATPFKNAPEAVYGQTIGRMFQEYIEREHLGSKSGRLYRFTPVPQYNRKEATAGSQYLLPDWTEGTAIGSKGEQLGAGCFFNYDKIRHLLLWTNDKVEVHEVNMDELETFRLHVQTGDREFDRLPGESKNGFAERIAGSPGKPSLFREITTKFEKSNFYSDGLVQAGKNYDEYEDAYTYFLSIPGAGSRKIELRRKSINEVFSPYANQITSYLSAHRWDFINEDYLVGFVKSLN